jgi:hypothetical protein
VARLELRLLRQVADLDAGHGHGLALDLLVEAGHDLEHGRLARAVEPQKADLGAREERERDVLEDLPLGRDDLAHAVHREYVLRHGGTFRLKGCGAGKAFHFNRPAPPGKKGI